MLVQCTISLIQLLIVILDLLAGVHASGQSKTVVGIELHC